MGVRYLVLDLWPGAGYDGHLMLWSCTKVRWTRFQRFMRKERMPWHQGSHLHSILLTLCDTAPPHLRTPVSIRQRALGACAAALSQYARGPGGRARGGTPMTEPAPPMRDEPRWPPALAILVVLFL